MKRILKLFRFVDGVNDTPFPNEEEQIITGDFEYHAGRMGGSPSISATAKHTLCLDGYWADKVYAEFNGEKYFVMNTPSSRKSNTDERYEHDIVMVSEREILANVLFFDAVDQTGGSANDKPKSNSTAINFMGDIHEFAGRLRASLMFSGIDYDVDDRGVDSDIKLVSFKDKYIFEALQEAFNVFEVPYYFVGKTIKFGTSPNIIQNVFKYGAENSLLAISKENANFRVINRITGVGSLDNIPYYYPNPTSKGTIDVDIPSTNVTLTKRDVNIIDAEAFADNFSLTSKCEYKENTYEVPITSNISVKHEGGYIPYENKSDIEVTFEVYADLATANKNFKIEIDLNEDSNVFLNADFFVFEGLETTYRFGLETFNTPFVNGRKLSRGKHTILIGVSMQYPERNTDPQADDYDYVSHIGSMNISSHYVYKKKEWMLDGSLVDLKKYGIRINGGKEYTVGDSFGQKVLEYITPSPNLMPPIYRQSGGAERFYNAVDDEYEDENGNYYTFFNQWSADKPLEAVQDFAEIKPTILNVTNANGEHINQFLEFAYDRNDNDELIEGTNEYQHPYFFAKLRKTDGQFGFNLFSAANEKRTMVVSMTSGVCGACEFEIGVGEKTKKNIVQVDEFGNLMYDESGKVVLRAGSPQNRQNDTSKYETWIALKKDITTYKEYSPMPNVTGNFRPSPEDTFVLTGINLPQAYILAAEDKLEKALIRFMYDNNKEKFAFSIVFSRIFLEENRDVLNMLDENATISIEYDNSVYQLFVQDYTYKMSGNAPLPEISVTLADELVAGKNSLQNVLDSVKFEVTDKILNNDLFLLSNRKYIRKDTEDFTRFLLTMYKGASFGDYKENERGAKVDPDGNAEFSDIKSRKKIVTKELRSEDFLGGILGRGFSLFKDYDGKSCLEVDNLLVRMKAAFTELEIDSLSYAGGNWVFSPAGAVCSFVEELDDGYKCYINTSNGSEAIKNKFRENDFVHCREFNVADNKTSNTKNRQWTRICNEVGTDYIILSKRSSGSPDIPMAGDSMVTFGNTLDRNRQNAIIISAYGDDSPSIIQYEGVNSSIPKEENIVTVISPKGNKFTGSFFSKATGKELESVINQNSENINISIRDIKDMQIGGENFYSSNSKITLEKIARQDESRIIRQDKYGFEILGNPSTYTNVILDTPFKYRGWYNIGFNIATRTNPALFTAYVEYNGKSVKLGEVRPQGSGIKSTRYSFPFFIGEDYTEGTPIHFSFRLIDYEYYDFIDVMIEKGSHGNPWKPSEYDEGKALLDTGINIERKEITVTADKFKVRANDGTPYIDVFKDRAGSPVIEAPNLNIDNIKAKFCNIKNGTISGILLRDATEIRDNNISHYGHISHNQQGKEIAWILDFGSIGNMSIFNGAFTLPSEWSSLVIELPSSENDGGLNADSFRYVGSNIIIINKSNVPIQILSGFYKEQPVGSGIFITSPYKKIQPGEVIYMECDFCQISKEPQSNFAIGWKEKSKYKIYGQSQLMLE